ncbi:hypothetical protein OIO90_002800 [Microbotryomycetes sp. JL221]|nr:hypothetical protein OIO90_002800 [Microbotryomycetes sp. JL221]
MLTFSDVRKRLPRTDLVSYTPLLVALGAFVGLRALWGVLKEILPPSWYPGTAKLDESGTLVDDEERKLEREADYKAWQREDWHDKVKQLSEDPNISVLVLEAGHSDTLQIFSRIPATFSKLFNHPTASWGYEFEPTDSVRGRKLMCPRSRMYGGCSSINAMMCHWCSPSDFDEIVELTGFQAFAYDKLLPYFTKSQTSTDHPNWKVKEYAARGRTGPVRTGYFYPLNVLSQAFIDACVKVGVKRRDCINTNDDGQGTMGTSRIATLIDKGSRVSTSIAYLTPDVIARPNLTVVSGATVTRILFSDEETPRAVGVEYTPLDLPFPALAGNTSRPLYRVSAKRDVLLAAGSIATPQLLKVSGVGPRSELEPLGIKVVSDLSDVGEHLKDHLASGCFYVAQQGVSLQWLSHPVKSLSALYEWLKYKSGPLTTNIAESVAFVRSDDPTLAQSTGVARPQGLPDYTSGRKGPDIEIICGATAFAKHGTIPAPLTTDATDFFAIAPILLRPKSEGTVTIKSKDVFVRPVIDAQFLTHEEDVKMLSYGTKLCQAIAASQPLSSLLVKPFNPPNAPNWPAFPYTSVSSNDKSQVFTDSELDEWVRRHAEVLYHPVGTVRLGASPTRDNDDHNNSKRGRTGCLDRNLKIHGTQGLRVCDASIFPEQLSGHPMMPLIAISEMFSDVLKREVKESM